MFDLLTNDKPNQGARPSSIMLLTNQGYKYNWLKIEELAAPTWAALVCCLAMMRLARASSEFMPSSPISLRAWKKGYHVIGNGIHHSNLETAPREFMDTAEAVNELKS